MDSPNSKRIAKNSLYLYVRMLLVMGVTLYTSRIVLEVLGITDFGIYNVVGGFVAILGFFTSSLSNVTQRYINIGLGKNSPVETEHAFRQSFTLLLCISLLVLVIGETFGLWFVYNKLVIPPDRLAAAVWVFQFSILSLFFGINQVVLMGAVIAHEKMSIYAYLGLFEAIAKLLIVYLLKSFSSIDSLILYGALTALISIITYIFYLVYCVNNFNESRFTLLWNRKLVKEMGAFISYNLFGCFAWSAGIQGTNIILNLFFGPIVNAARAISVQISAVVTRFTDNIMTAVKPQIIKSYVTGNRDYMFLLIEKSSRYSYFLAAILAIPIMFEVNFILRLWLGQVPEYSAAFTRLVLCDALVGIFTPSLWIATNATGNIKNNQVYGRIITLLILPFSYVVLLLYSNPILPFYLTLLFSVLYWFYCLWDVNRQIGLPLKNYIVSVIKPACILSISLFLACYIIMCSFENESLIRFLVLIFFSTIVGLLTVYFLLDKDERSFVKNQINKVFSK